MATALPTRRRSAGRRPAAPDPTTEELLTLAQVLELLQVPRSTFYGWIQRGVGPKHIKYPNGKIRVRRNDLEAWLAAQEVSA